MNNEYKRIWLVVFVTFVSSYSLFSQEIVSGNIQTIEGNAVGVQIIDLASSKIIALTDNNGEFSFESSSKHFATSYLGYQPDTFFWEGTKLSIYLEQNIDLLNTVVVSENKRETAIKNATVSLELISPELIENTASPQMDETIGRINGVQVVDQQPNIRSGGGWSYGAGSRVQVLVNDIPLLSGDAGQPLWSFIPTEGVERIEVIKGAASVIYGSSALNGVINIVTKDPSKQYSNISISSGFYDKPKRASLDYAGSRGLISNISAYHSTSHNDVGYSVALNALDDNGYKMGDHDKRIRLQAGVSKTISDKNMKMGLNSSFQSGNSSSFLLWESLDLGYTALDSSITQTNTQRFTVDPWIKWSTEKSSNNFNLRYLNVSNTVDNGDSLNDQSNFSSLIFGEFRNQRKISRLGVNLLSGLVGIYTSTNSPLFSGSQTMTNLSGYLQIDKKWGPLLWTGGVRYEHFTLNERAEGRPVFRSGLNWEMGKFSFLRASFGQGYRFPSIAETFISTSVGPVTVYSNESLEAETGDNIELGFKQGFKVKKINMLYDVALYQMRFDNMMEFTFGQWAPFINFDSTGLGFKTLNTGKTRIRGIENTISFQYKNGSNYSVQGFVGYNYVMPVNLNPDEIIAQDLVGNDLSFSSTSHNDSLNILKYRPRHLFKTDIMFLIKNFSIGFGATYQSKMENIDAAFTGPLIGLFVPGMSESYDQNQTRYFIVNSRLGYKLKSGVHLNLIASNLSNVEFAYRPADLGPPRSIRFQLSYSIK